MTFLPCVSQVTGARTHLYIEADGAKDPIFVRSCLSLVIYRVSKGEQSKEMSVHLAYIKSYFAPFAGSDLEFDTLNDLFIGTKIYFPDFDNVTSQV